MDGTIQSTCIMFLWKFNCKQKIFSCTWFKLAKEGSHCKNNVFNLIHLIEVVGSLGDIYRTHMDGTIKSAGPMFLW